jgi:hypothetical protein
MIKKIVGFSIAAAFLGLPMFAQEAGEDAGKLKITGELKTGIQAYNDTVVLHSDDIGDGTGLRADLNAGYDAGNWGLNIGLRGNVSKGWRQNVSNTGTAGDPEVISDIGLREGFAFFKPFGDMLDIKAGLIDTAVWNTAGLDDENLSNGYGLRLELVPVPGLNAGVVLGGTNLMLTGESGDHFLTENFFKHTTIGASYTSDAFYAAAAFKLKRDTGVTLYTPAGAQAVHLDVATADNVFTFGFGLTAIENLDLTLEVLFLDGFESKESAKINLDTLYSVGQIHAGLEAVAVSLEDFYIDVTPKAGYDITGKLIADLFIPLSVHNADDEFGVAIKPQLTCKLNDSSKLVIFDRLDIKYPGDDKLHNTVQIDFVYSF